MRSIMAQRCSAKAGPSRSPRPRAGGRSWCRICRRRAQAGASRRRSSSWRPARLGTNELLLRAQQRGLELSAKLGEKFSANGDDLVFADKLAEPVNAIATGFPPQAPRGAAPVGPHSMALIDLGDEHGPLWVHDGTMMALMAALAPLEESAATESRGMPCGY